MELLKQQIDTLRQSLFSEEILDIQFTQLEKLEDEDSPNFLEETLALYFSDAPKIIATVEQAAQSEIVLDFNNLDTNLHRLKGSSASIGAIMVVKKVNKALECCRNSDLEGCKAAVQTVKLEYDTLRNRLQTYFQLRRQARSANHHT